MTSINFKTKDIVQILSLFSQEVEEMFFVVDKKMKVHYYNKAFSEYFKLNSEEILNAYFGTALACNNIVKDGRSCTKTTYCQFCEINLNLNRILNKKIPRADFDLVREFNILNEPLIKHLQFKILPLQIQENSYALCVLKDLRENDHLRLYQNPSDSI
ncbi:MAG: hypothetical protein JW857_02150 [Bacteroidales bacterium]|nr:hypothetical protein [Bacteroidales bacterium]